MKLGIRIHKRLPNVTIDVSFTCEAGQILAVVGPSGAGKTTILRAIAGLEQPDDGCVVFNNNPWFDRKRKINVSPQKRKVGYVSQGYGLFPHLSVTKNIAFAASKKEMTGQLMELFKISPLADSRPDQISGGERQRVALAQALATEPNLMLLDEPFSALDYKTKNALRNELVSMKNRLGLPIIMVTHDLDDAIKIADQILPIEHGVFAPGWLPENLHYVAASPYTENDIIMKPNAGSPLPFKLPVSARHYP
ncbi:MAG: ATP-binding cassette domain-containing protein [Proteobacteria bacterium]|nr:ATP-binding cassette domain-containing protein [Pseudomonadota bacterium]MBU1714194.1 ATP-binding cassette domain-containing protein [Pseudomonadota bacterium]